MGVVDIIAAIILLAILALFRYVWKHRKIAPKRKRVKLERKGERYGKSRAAERDCNKPNGQWE